LSVSLPLSCAHVALFAFDNFASRVEDQVAILRWRFQQDERVTVGDAHLAYRVFGERSPKQSLNEKKVTYVLAVAAKPQVLQQYQQVLHEAGVIPVSIGWSTLQVYDLARGCMQRGREIFFLNEDVDSWTLIAAREGIPVYMRHRSGQALASDHPDQLRRTLQFYEDLFPHHSTGHAPVASNLYRFPPQREVQSEMEDRHHLADAEAFMPYASPSWQVALAQSNWMGRPGGAGLNSMTEWSAYAGIVTA
jgi:hypothetical protein